MTNDELKQTAESAEKSPEKREPAKNSDAAKKSPAKSGSASKKSSGGKSASSKKASDSDYVHTTTAPAEKKSGSNSKNVPSNGGAGKKNASQGKSESMPSSKPAHRVLPYVLFGLAVFLGVCMLLNLFCNGGNQFASDPGAHPMGSVGYWVCYLFFGLFGAGALLIPFIMVYMALYWKDFLDNKILAGKAIVSFLLILFFSGFIHSFSFIQLDKTEWKRTADELMSLGAQIKGGGVIGGGFGYFLAYFMNWLGALTVGFLLSALTAFLFVGQSPIRLIKRAIVRAKIKRAEQKAASVSEKSDEKEQKKNEKEAEKEAPAEDHPAEQPRVRRKRSRSEEKNTEDEDDGLAPMPMPILDASDDTPVNNLYVPADIGKNMQQNPASHRVTVPGGARPAPNAGKTTPDTAATNRQPTATATTMETVFPRSAADAKNTKRMQKGDQNFELGNIFVEKRAQPQTATKRHAPLPPEAPLPTGGMPQGARTAPPAPSQRPAPNAAGNRPANGAPVNGAPSRAATSQARANDGQRPAAPMPNGKRPIMVRPATAPAGIKPSPELEGEATAAKRGQKPIFRPSDGNANAEYGLSNEEFEKREANANAISNASRAKSASATNAKAANTDKKATESAKKATAKDETSKKPTEDASGKAYVFPPISYLHPSEPMTAENHSEIKANMEKLYATLSDFNVRINEITYSCGPTVTRYEIYPSAGVRVRTITNLADDIALAFAVQSVRMEAIPGKSAIGVEVPNTTRQTVFLRELLESPAFTDKPSRLTAGLGADVAGAPLLFDISKMPHLLVAGATGMGKSVCINCIIMSILFKARPDQVKLILVDPKKVEFSLYKGIPHLMAPIIVTPKDAAGALQAAVLEMEDRFTKIQDVGVSNIEGYNKAAEKDPDLPPMPHIVIIIDELADLMLTARDEVEDSICRLAQKARAAGMHIIVGTQRPSVDVVTGLIKSNIPSRVACTVASQVDSRTILDIAGAEKLLGKGDMLFAPVGSMKPTRVQGAFVADSEVEKICEFIRATNGTAVYNEAFTSKMKEYSAMCGNKKNKGEEGTVSLPGESGDNKYVDAIRVSIEENRVSTSLLQRKLGIGYSRAAKIIDRMEEEGLVSKPDGSKPRNILISAEQFIERYIEGDAGAERAEDEEE